MERTGLPYSPFTIYHLPPSGTHLAISNVAAIFKSRNSTQVGAGQLRTPAAANECTRERL
jgi:hypothetical protein